MQRYKALTEEFVDSSRTTRYASIDYPYFPHRDTDVYIISKVTDRLDILADTYYDDHTLWWVIARANDLGKGTLNVPPGIRIRIPLPVSALVIDEIIRER